MTEKSADYLQAKSAAVQPLQQVAAKWGDGAFHDIRAAALQYVEQSSYLLQDGQRFYPANEVRGMLTDFAGHMSIESAEQAIRMMIEAAHDELCSSLDCKLGDRAAVYRQFHIEHLIPQLCARLRIQLAADIADRYEQTTDSGAKKIAQVEPWMKEAAQQWMSEMYGVEGCDEPWFAEDLAKGAQIIAKVYAEHAPGIAPPAYSEQIVVNLARELYDRFVMGGWQPEDAYPQIRTMLGLSAAPKEGDK